MQFTSTLYRRTGALLMLGLGLFQAWSSGALTSPLHGLLQVLGAVLLPPGAVLLSKRGGVWAAAVVVSALLLLAVRWTMPRPLPALLMLVTLQVAVLYCLYRFLWKDRRSEAPIEPSTLEVTS